jgi:exodeoxyribonuclease V alpha subunit
MHRPVADGLPRRCVSRSQAPFPYRLDSVAPLAAITSGVELDALQRQAVHMAVSKPLSVLCGGAGTGKTTVLRAVIAAARAAHGYSSRAPGGALRARGQADGSTTGAPGLTVYRLLWACGAGSCQRACGRTPNFKHFFV